MLTSLHIENFAIVSKLDLEFGPGMTAFTGETGAGKSIMIDALLLALGGRADTSVIRQGADKCDITASFQIEANAAIAPWLNEHDISFADGEVVLRRVLFAEGRSKSTVNGQPLSLQQVKTLSSMLVDIHGQHQHQTLLEHQSHRQQLDHYAKHTDLQEEVLLAYKRCHEMKQALVALDTQHASAERIALLQFQLEELTALQLSEGEVSALHQEHLMLHNAKDYLQHTEHLIGVLKEDEQFNLSHAMHGMLQHLAQLPQENDAIKNALEMINNAVIQCDEAFTEISRFQRQVQLDPERLQDVETRMSLLHQAARKYHTEPTQLIQKLQEIEASLHSLQNVDVEKQRLEADYRLALESFEHAALRLRESRQQHAKNLCAEITNYIHQLGMPKGYIDLVFTPLDKMHPHGMDKIEYIVCTNPGMAADTLARIASGGELSRISLAIQLVTAQRGATPTLLFDEVDVGIGGATAALVGQMLRQLGERLQLFCVTHQPQVAACAHAHFRVEKYSEGEMTYSRVSALGLQEKINEISRMLGGLTITEHTRSHARELLGVE